MVPRVHSNLSTPGIQTLKLTQFILKAITLVGVTLTASFWWTGTTLHKNIDGLEDQIHTIMVQTKQIVDQAKTHEIDLSDHAIQQLPEQISFVKQVRERVGFSWTQLLTDLEAALPGSIRMNAVSLEEKTNTVLLNGSTQSLQDLNQLIHRLETHPAFHDVILSQHANKQKKETQDQSTTVFSMKVFYDPNHPQAKAKKS